MTDSLYTVLSIFNYKRVCKSLKDRCALPDELSSFRAGAKVILFLLAPNVLKFIFKLV